MKFQKKQSCHNRKQLNICLGSWKGETELTAKGMRELSKLIEMSYLLIALLVRPLSIFFKTHGIIHLKLVNFTVCELYLDKADKKIKTKPMNKNNKEQELLK